MESKIVAQPYLFLIQAEFNRLVVSVVELEYLSFNKRYPGKH